MSVMNRATDVPDELANAIVSAARTSLSDTLRSVVYFTPSSFDVLYVRPDVYATPEAARPVKEDLVKLETTGFAESPIRTAMALDEDQRSIGAYEFTVRVHADGFVARVISNDAGVIVTTDGMNVRAFEEAMGAIRSLLEAN